MNNISNESIKVYKKNIIILKFILLFFLIVIDIKFKKIVEKYFYELYKTVPKLQYYYIDMKPYEESIDLENGGKLEIYTNNNSNNSNTSKEEIITKNNEKILRSEIMFLVIPGGSYKKIGEVEALPVAKKFFHMGYSSSVLRYSVAPSCYPINYNQGLTSIEILSKKFKKIIIIGFSAGGHLAGLLGTSGKDKLFNTIAMILCYPVISFVNNVHVRSRYYFFGDKNENSEKNWKLFSIENRVNHDTLPTFIWTIRNDKIVPYENTLNMIDSLKKNNVKYDYRIYKKGVHGMALADEFDIRYGNINYKNDKVAKWIHLSLEFIEDILKNC